MLLHIFQIVKFLTIKAKYNVIEPYYMEGTTPDWLVVFSGSPKFIHNSLNLTVL